MSWFHLALEINLGRGPSPSREASTDALTERAESLHEPELQLGFRPESVNTKEDQ